MHVNVPAAGPVPGGTALVVWTAPTPVDGGGTALAREGDRDRVALLALLAPTVSRAVEPFPGFGGDPELPLSPAAGEQGRIRHGQQRHRGPAEGDGVHARGTALAAPEHPEGDGIDPGEVGRVGDGGAHGNRFGDRGGGAVLVANHHGDLDGSLLPDRLDQGDPRAVPGDADPAHVVVFEGGSRNGGDGFGDRVSHDEGAVAVLRPGPDPPEWVIGGSEQPAPFDEVRRFLSVPWQGRDDLLTYAGDEGEVAVLDVDRKS